MRARASDSRRFYSEDLDDKLVKRIRAAETAPGITRVVLELIGDVEATTSQLANPNRLIVELRGAAPGLATPPATAPALPAAITALPAVVKPSPPKWNRPRPPRRWTPGREAPAPPAALPRLRLAQSRSPRPPSIPAREIIR